MRHARPTSGDWMLLAALSFMWGTSFLFTKIAVHSAAPPIVVTGRLSIAAVGLTILARITGLRFPPPGVIWLRFLALAVMGNALPFYLITWGQQRIDSGLAGILMAVMPLATLFLAHFLVDGERLTARKAIGFVAGFGGITLLLGPEAMREIGGAHGHAAGQAAVLGGALCYAVNAVMARRLPPMHVLVVSAATLTVASVVMVVVVALQARSLPSVLPSPRAMLAVLWLGVVSTAIATVVYFRIIASAGPTFLSLINYFIPIVAVAAGALVLAERPGGSALLALVLILGGVATSQRG